jgi:hypothetical protein
MRIERVVIKNLGPLKHRDDRFSNQDGPWQSLCIRGLNGSGKTTYLGAIAHLWEWFRRCTRKRNCVLQESSSWLWDAELVAIKLTGLPGPYETGWIAWGDEDRQNVLEGLWLLHGKQKSLYARDFLEWWDDSYTKAELGQERIANLVWLEAESRWIPPLKKNELLQTGQTPVKSAVARYLPGARGTHLESQLATIKLVNEKQWSELQEWIKELFPGLSLWGFDEDTRRPLFCLDDGTRLTVEELSAGERAALISLILVMTQLGPGGIVLIDEPELHQHVSLMRGNVAVIEELVRQAGGMLIVASHAPEVWDQFRITDAFIELEGRKRLR